MRTTIVRINVATQAWDIGIMFRSYLKRCALAGALLLICCRAHGNDRFEGMDAYIEEALKTWQVPGLAIAIVKDDAVVLLRGYGVSQIGTDRKVTTDTRFHLASCTKSFIATGIALLVEDGKLRWDDPVVKHLPELELADRKLTGQVTLRDLLCHRTGLRRADLLADAAGFEPRIIVSRLKHLEPVADLRTRYIYNNHMYTVLGEVIERVSGQPWEAFIEKRILRPLTMSSTTASVAKLPPDQIARRHWRADEGIAARQVDEGMRSTVRDMAQWTRLQLGQGTYAGRPLLKAETIQEMQALQFSVPLRRAPGDNPYAAQFYGSGLGWAVQDYRGRKMVSHSGAWGSVVAMLPEEQLGVVVLSNLDLEYLDVLLAYDVFDAYLVGPETAWNPAKWESTWLRIEPPGLAWRARDEEKARLDATRIENTRPSLPLAQYAGDYASALYGRLSIEQDHGQLAVTFAGFTTKLSHWQEDSFYARAPTRLTFDWLLSFEPTQSGSVPSVVVKHIGWDEDEKDHRFTRAGNVVED